MGTDRRGPVALIINPISGTGGRPEVARRRAALAAHWLDRSRAEGEIFVTERPGHARELARAAAQRGASVIAAWGGDGTVNEIASVLAFQSQALAIIPSGSGNGLARELGIPLDPYMALDVALNGRERIIDCGELDGRLFFNIAGFGLDARVAHEFAAHGLVRRGVVRYLEIAARELWRCTPIEHTLVGDGQITHTRALIIAIANGRQYGNGALIAPQARVDDGRLDIVVVSHRSALRALMQVPKLFRGQIASVPGVTMMNVVELEVTSGHSMHYHIDGEPFVGGASVKGRVHAAALRVRVPARAG